ncbi:MAG: MBL fold metallo-hydrolase [Pseudomonadota bacterium]
MLIILGLALLLYGSTAAGEEAPFVIVLGIGQDGGLPQLGREDDPAWRGGRLPRTATSLALVRPGTGQRWLFEATPDIRQQMRRLSQWVPRDGTRGSYLDGIFLTHAHIGHYAGLMLLGHESMGARDIPVYAMPRMRDYLTTNGPWTQLVDYGNIALRPLEADRPTALGEELRVTPFLVPHRDEFSETVGYRIDGPNRSLVFIPDIDSWEEFDAQGTAIEALVQEVDYALLDATFFDNNEIPGRDMSGFPHPRIRDTMDRLSGLAEAVRNRVMFIHLNHTNPALDAESEARSEIIRRGFSVAEPGQRLSL